MPKTLSEVTRDAVDLPLPERYQLARILLDQPGKDEEPPAEVQAAWDNEIERRLQELRSGNVKAVPLEEVKQGIVVRLGLISGRAFTVSLRRRRAAPRPRLAHTSLDMKGTVVASKRLR